MKSYHDLEVYQDSLALFFRVHPFSLQLPKHELYELGSQIRRSSESVNTNIIEGYGRRRYKSDFIKFLVYAHASTLETKGHLEKIRGLYPLLNEEASILLDAYDQLGARIFTFIQYVEKHWNNPPTND